MLGGLQLRIYPDPILLVPAADVPMPFGRRELVQKMFKSMYRHAGVGLAAPQAGYSIRLAVLNQFGDSRMVESEKFLINPRITGVSEKLVESHEGCLSCPGVRGLVRRPSWIEVKATRPDGQPSLMYFDGFEARVVCHEIDHLDGKLFIHHLDENERKRIESDLRRLQKS